MPGASNSSLDVETPGWTFGERLSGVPIPVFTLEPAAVAAWANLVSGARGFVGATLSQREKRSAPVPNTSTVTGDERVRRFRALVSPEAYQLAVYLAAVPLTLPVMRLVHRTMFRQPVLTQLAEFMLGDLIRQRPTADGGAGYEFYDGVREALQAAMLRSEALTILEAVSRYVESNFGSALDFEALLSSERGTPALAEQAKPFATIALGLLERVTHSAAGALAGLADATAVAAAGSQLPHPARVLVAGTGSYDVSRAVFRVSEMLGRRLAEDGYLLTIGGWEGVDYIVADAFCKALGSDAGGRLRQYVEINSTPRFHGDLHGGEVIKVETDAATFDVSAADADVAILVGGVGENRILGQKFLELDKPVVPIAGTEGDAKIVFDDLSRSFHVLGKSSAARSSRCSSEISIRTTTLSLK